MLAIPGSVWKFLHNSTCITKLTRRECIKAKGGFPVSSVDIFRCFLVGFVSVLMFNPLACPLEGNLDNILNNVK